MSNIHIKNAAGNDAYLAATGAGTDGDPHVPEQAVTESNSGAILTQLQAIDDALLGPLAVTGPLTDAQLRAASVPVSAPVVAVTTQATTHAASGDNAVITAPGAGNRLVIVSIVVQNESGNSTTVLLKDGALTKRRALLKNQGDGISWVFGAGREWRLGNNAALVLNLSGANSHGVTVDYWQEVV